MSLSRSFWSGRRVLVTGHTGFKGAWLARVLCELGAEVTGLALAPDPPGGAYEQMELDSRVRSVLADIRDRDALAAVVAEDRPEIVLHLAAQALVRASFADPVATFDVNVAGTAAVLEAATAAPSTRVVVAVTSDKVYANDGAGHAFVETDRLGGGDPYSASKAAAELVVASWRHSFVGEDGPVLVTARAGNVIGGGDRAADRLLPDLFRSMDAGRPLVVRHPESVRPWQFVLDPVVGYLTYAEAAWNTPTVPPALNFGPDAASCWRVDAVVDRAIELAGGGAWERDHQGDGAREAAVLRLDAGLAHRAIGWEPVLDLDEALAWTVAWHRAEAACERVAVLADEQVSVYLDRVGIVSAPICRSCGAPLRVTVVDLGLQPLSNAYLLPDDVDAEARYPLHARYCEVCHLVQVDDVVPPDAIFSDYAYFSSFSDTWVAQAKAFAGSAVERLGLGPDSFVVEVASNDGYLLRHFVDRGVPVLGIEPAANVAETARAAGVPTDVRFFGLETADATVAGHRGADLVVANNVLAHVPDLNDFVAGLERVLAPGGVVSIEFPHLLRLVDETQFDTIYHEHYSYFSLVAAQGALGRHGLTVFDVEELASHGGSLRISAGRTGDASHPVQPVVAEIVARERAARLDQPAGFTGFAERVQACCDGLRAFLVDQHDAGATVAAYGAAAKGNTLLNAIGADPDLLAFVVDRNPRKQGRLLPGSHVPIHDVEHLVAERPPYILILPWNLRDEIVDQMAVVRDWGGRFVVAVPEIEIF